MSEALPDNARRTHDGDVRLRKVAGRGTPTNEVKNVIGSGRWRVVRILSDGVSKQ